MRRFRIIFFAVFIVFSMAALAAEQYNVDPKHSSATFSVRHMMISNVPGRFSNVSGTIVYDEKDLSKSSVAATIKTGTINTDNSQRDNHLKSPDFLDVQKYPEMTFKSKRIEKRGDQLVAIGTLTIKNVSKDIELPFELTKANLPGGPTLGVTVETRINRLDYGVSWNKTLDGGGAVVSDAVKITISLEARPAAPAPATSNSSK